MHQTEATFAELMAPDRPDDDGTRPSAPPKARVSVLVPVKNEEANLRRCLPALA